MFSKALFKQSCKANGVMWSIITAAVCFMLACVMLISGSGNISDIKNSVEDTIIVETIDSNMDKQALTFYERANQGTKLFDNSFVLEYKNEFLANKEKADEYSQKVDAWLVTMPVQTNYTNMQEYLLAMQNWQQNVPAYEENSVEMYYIGLVSQWLEQAPKSSDFESTEAYQQALAAWNNNKPTSIYATYAMVAKEKISEVYLAAVKDVQDQALVEAKKLDEKNDENSSAYKEIMGSMLFAINPGSNFDSMYEEYEPGSTPKEDYDVATLVQNITVSDLVNWAKGEEASDIKTYLNSDTRKDYRIERTQYATPILLAGNLTSEETTQKMLIALNEFGVTKEKYDSFGYTYEGVKKSTTTSIIAYQARLDYEISLINRDDYQTEEAYNAAVLEATNKLQTELSNGLLDALPSEVSDAIEEIGKMDLYALIVGSIFFKMAGLLLPIIYIIMVSNNLISGQVDSGSMAYVLSTSTKRKEVTFTQACYLIGSLFLMMCATTITSCICFAFVDPSVTELTYGELILLNLGAFITLFAISGINFLTSCWFDRSKRSMALGGGFSMFFLVATMLGLFGSQVIPSVVRLDALNNFNYVSLITLFDSVAIISGTTTFIWKLAILFVIGLVGYVIGSIRFKKKDLPL